MNRKLIGEVGVDSGQVIITDPCYIDNEWEESSFDDESDQTPTHEYSYAGACQATLTKDQGGQLNYRLGHAGAGVVVSSGYGDGLYPVFASYGADGRIHKLEIIFIEKDDA